MAEKSQAAVLNMDVLLPDELLSGLLTQCSVQPELLSVMEDLFDSAGETPTSLESTPRRLLTVKPCIEGGCSHQDAVMSMALCLVECLSVTNA